MRSNRINMFIVLAYVTLVLGVFSVFVVDGIKVYITDRDYRIKTDRDNHIKAMGEACIQHVNKLSASANADKQDIYSFNEPKDAQNYKWQATAQCLITYPLYSNDDPNETFNLSL